MQFNSLSVELTPQERGVYSNLFHLADVGGRNRVEGKPAVDFFKQSGLPVQLLREIWTIASSRGQHQDYLDKEGFYIALRLIAYAQNNIPVSPQSILNNIPVQLPTFSIQEEVVQDKDPWEINSEQNQRYCNIFREYSQGKDCISGMMAKEILQHDWLELQDLRKVLELVDFYKNNQMNQDQFIVAMFIIERKIKENVPVPMHLPEQLLRKLQHVQQEIPQIVEFQRQDIVQDPNLLKQKADILAVIQKQIQNIDYELTHLQRDNQWMDQYVKDIEKQCMLVSSRWNMALQALGQERQNNQMQWSQYVQQLQGELQRTKEDKQNMEEMWKKDQAQVEKLMEEKTMLLQKQINTQENKKQQITEISFPQNNLINNSKEQESIQITSDTVSENLEIQVNQENIPQETNQVKFPANLEDFIDAVFVTTEQDIIEDQKLDEPVQQEIKNHLQVDPPQKISVFDLPSPTCFDQSDNFNSFEYSTNNQSSNNRWQEQAKNKEDPFAIHENEEHEIQPIAEIKTEAKIEISQPAVHQIEEISPALNDGASQIANQNFFDMQATELVSNGDSSAIEVKQSNFFDIEQTGEISNNKQSKTEAQQTSFFNMEQTGQIPNDKPITTELQQTNFFDMDPTEQISSDKPEVKSANLFDNPPSFQQPSQSQSISFQQFNQTNTQQSSGFANFQQINFQNMSQPQSSPFFSFDPSSIKKKDKNQLL